MTSYPALKRWLAAGLTVIVLGVAIHFVARNGGTTPVESGVLAQGPKEGDWTMYGGTPARNMANPIAKGLPVTWDIGDPEDKPPRKPVNVKWFAGLGSKSYGGPIVANGRVFIGTNNQDPRDKKWVQPNGDPVDLGIVMCFEEAGGKFVWQAVHEKLPGGQVIDWPLQGICSSPYVDGDRLYYISNRCEVVRADVATGKADWTYDMIKELRVFPHNIADCSPLMIKGHLWAVTSNGVNEDHLNVPEPKAPSFIKLKVDKDLKNVTVPWQQNWPTAYLLQANKGNLPQADFFKQLVNRGQLVQHGQWANPAYGEINGQSQVVFPGGDGWLYSVDLDGNLLWKFDCNPKNAKYALRTGDRSDFIATPVIYKNRVYIGIGQDPEHKTGVGHFWCIDMTKKPSNAEKDVSPEVVTDNSVFPPKTKPNPDSAKVWHYGGFINDPATIKKLRRNYYFGRTMSTAAIHEDILYISDLNGVLHCMDANSGKLHWEHDTKNEIWSSPYYADGKVYLGTDDKMVFVFQHGTTKKKLAENEMDGRIRATPIAANGVLYVMTENKLYALK